MILSAQQAADFERDGFLVFPDLFSQAKVDVLRAETARLSATRPTPAEDRWHNWVVSRNTRPLPIEDDGAIVHASEERKSSTARV